MMPLDPVIAQMRGQAKQITAAVEYISDAQARWKPSDEDWSILEGVNHLYDEEREDFRARLDAILHKPGQEMPPTDPLGWVTERDYHSRDLATALQNFLTEREASIAWLQSLDTPNWEAAYVAEWGSIRAGDMLMAWVAHDLLHIRQINALHYLWLVREAQPYDVGYAGKW